MKNFEMVNPEAESLQGKIAILDHLTTLSSKMNATDEEKAKAFAQELVQLEYEDFIQHQGSIPMEVIVERVAIQAYLKGMEEARK